MRSRIYCSDVELTLEGAQEVIRAGRVKGVPSDAVVRAVRFDCNRGWLYKMRHPSFEEVGELGIIPIFQLEWEPALVSQ